MLSLIVVAISLASLAAADDHCTPLNIIQVRRQWFEVFETGNDRVEFGQTLFKAVLAKHPAFVEHYAAIKADNIYSPEFKAAMLESLSNLDVAISLLDDEAASHEHSANIAKKHVANNTPRELLPSIHEALMEVVPAKMKRCFDMKAWEGCLDHLEKDIQHSRDELEKH